MDPNSRAAKMALLGRKKIGREDHEKKQRRIDRLAEDWEEVGGSFNDSFQSWTLPGSGSAEGEERQYESGGESDVPKIHPSSSF